MSIRVLQTHFDLLNLYKIGSPQNHFNAHVLKFLVLFLIVKEEKIVGKS
jgi:hypothetical protein